MRRYWLLGILVVAAILLSWLVPNPGKPLDARALSLLPWAVEPLPEGKSRVFGITLGESRLSELQAVLGNDLELALVAAPDEEGNLEAYYSQLLLGFIQARMIVTVDAGKEQILHMRERASKAEYMESATKKIRLHPEDIETAQGLPIRALAVIPSANLEEAVLLERFGPPAERLEDDHKRVHLLYPAKGLAIVVDPKGKELLQYVAPRNFSVLREPLRNP
ncbi:hypothetical protein VX159_04455 [Dechloromonas sp. ZY10]|uniref:hypothetical protein n=1 Tax=Dechloromonas aquae TaxID=2664436 RepID=UPI0035275C26